MRQRLWAVALVVLLGASAIAIAPAAGAQTGCGFLGHDPGNRGYAVATQGGDVLGILRRATGLTGVVERGPGIVAFEGDLGLARILLSTAGIGAVVRPDVPRPFHQTPSDPGFEDQWNFPAIRAQQAWAITKGAPNIVVAAIDSGVDFGHPDLAGKLVNGFDATTNRPMTSGNSDNVGHGTATAGVIGAATSNGTGLASLGWDTKVMPIKAGDEPRVSAVIAGLRYAADNGARVINMSLGSDCPDDQEEAAVRYAQDKGALVVASSGNERQEGNPIEYPAGYPNVLAVGATGPDGTVTSYSNTGPNVGIVAPGGSNTQSVNNGILLLAPDGEYALGVGTSFSAPMVAAAAGLVLAANPSRTALEVSGILTSTAQDRGPAGRDDEYGAGILDAGAAVAGAGSGGGTGDPVFRLSGSDRMATAVTISQDSWTAQAAGAVVVARADVFPDALAGAALATKLGGPLLLTASTALDGRASSEIQRVLPSGRTVHLLGGTTALSGQVASQVAGLGYSVVRYAGSDRFDTAVRVARDGLGNPDALFLADGLTFANALIAGSAAPRLNGAVVLTAGSGVPAPTRAYLDSRPGTQRIAIGSGAAAAEPGADKIVGGSAAETSKMVAERFAPDATSVSLASDANFPDSLGGGAHIAKLGGPLLLTNPQSLSPVVESYLASKKATIARGFVYGGPVAIADNVSAQLQAAIT